MMSACWDLLGVDGYSIKYGGLTCHSSMLMALSSWTRRVSRCMDWLSGLLRLMAVLWLWWRWIWPRCMRRLSQSLRNSALRVYCRQNLKAGGGKKHKLVYTLD